MNSIIFWRSWQNPLRIITSSGLIFFSVLLVGSEIIYLTGNNFIDWHVLSQKINIPVIHSFIDIGSFRFQVMANKSLIQEWYEGGFMINTNWMANTLLIVVAIALVIYGAITTYLKRFWYILSMTFVFGFFILFHAEMMEVFGLGNNWTLVLIYSFILIPGYYIHAYGYSFPVAKRLLIMSVAIGLLITIFFLFSQSTRPITTLAGYGLMAPFLVLLLFILTVAHEIMAAFIRVVSSSKGIKNNVRLRHFTVLSLIYIINLLLTYLHKTHVIEWDIIYLDPFLILAISSVLGFWGIRSRISLYSGASTSEEVWLIIYLVVGILSYITLNYILLSLNDPMIQVISDFIIYSHLCLAIAFFLYVIYNFVPLIEKGLAVHKVLYNPKNLPYLTYRLVGILGVFALVAMRGLDYPVWYSIGGYYNSMADQALILNNNKLAEIFYKGGAEYAFNNHKSYYSLGMMSSDNKVAENYFMKASARKPSAQSYANFSQAQSRESAHYEALFTLQEGVLKIPDSKLFNNLALQFLRLNLVDSADIALTKAGYGDAPMITNRLALIARTGGSIGADSATLLRDLTLPGLANAASLGLFPRPVHLFSKDNMYEQAYLNNVLLSHSGLITDSTLNLASTAIDSLDDQQQKQSLKFALALCDIEQGMMNEGLQLLQELAMNNADHSAEYFEYLGLFYLQIGSYGLAIVNLEQAIDQGRSSAELALAVAYAEDGRQGKALEKWSSLIKKRTDIAATSRLVIKILNDEEVVLTDDYSKVIAARFMKYSTDEIEIVGIVKTIENPYSQALCALDMCKFYLMTDNPYAAGLMLNVLPVFSNEDLLSTTYKMLKVRFLIRMKAPASELKKVLQSINTKYLTSVETLYIRLLSGQKPDSLTLSHLASDNAFFVEGVILASKYYQDDADPFRAYNALAEAIQVNPSSALLMKAYIFEALKTGLTSYAEDVLYQYGQQFPGQGFLSLRSEYEIQLKNLEELAEQL